MKSQATCLTLGLALLASSCAPEHQPTSPDRESSANRAAGGAARPQIAAAPSPWTDVAGEVTLTNSDIIGGNAVVCNGAVVLSVRFNAAPFPRTATQTIVWGFDLDQNPATGSVMGPVPGADTPAGSFLNASGTQEACCLSAAELCTEVGQAVDDACPCGGPWPNRGAYASCVARVAGLALAAREDECLSEVLRAEVHGCVVRPRVRNDCGRRTDRLPDGRQTSSR